MEVEAVEWIVTQHGVQPVRPGEECDGHRYPNRVAALQELLRRLSAEQADLTRRMNDAADQLAAIASVQQI